ncbi:hypothetical protein SETIT_7G079200v2 [Setaria italica]|uniref:Sulfotransferase n=1 Tax=Setaria italica TaxID=4555 RepID=K3YC69_SETIT|nr:cytosolic sulfotransferase 3 [Setaria italica]RCV33370.1 hypothetical protein SETIT_7G079200v2 [Setaria italica]
MANVTTGTSPATVLSGLSAPVPFKDVVVIIGDRDAGQQDADASAPEEYASAAVSALPSNPKLFLRRYQGTWVLEPWVPGIVSIQRGAFAPRRGDVVIASPPMCGAPWLKALAFAAMARGVHPPAADPAGHPLLRVHPDDCVPSMEKQFGTALGRKAMDALPSPRLMATHMHRSILPASIAENPDCKIVYICRDPKDMLVSMWQFSRKIRPDLEFSDLLEAACEGSCLSGPIWDHVLGYWNASKASPERVLFMRYEEMLQDPVGNVVKLSRFLGRPFSPDEEEAGVAMDVVRMCSKLKDLEVNRVGSGSSPLPGIREGGLMNKNNSYFSRGEVGDWANHMTPEMARRLDVVMEERLLGSGFSFC